MLTNINPKLPMRDKGLTRDFYLNKLGFRVLGDNGNFYYRSGQQPADFWTKNMNFKRENR
jgi:hypothetical protein